MLGTTKVRTGSWQWNEVKNNNNEYASNSTENNSYCSRKPHKYDSCLWQISASLKKGLRRPQLNSPRESKYVMSFKKKIILTHFPFPCDTKASVAADIRLDDSPARAIFRPLYVL
jgi:hypothetical protein